MRFFGGGKPKRIVVKRYRALTEGGARREMEKDANRMAAQGYRLTSVQDKSHKLAVNHGDVFATYELGSPSTPDAGPHPRA